MIDFTAIDFETANTDADSACAVGIVVVSDGEICEQRKWLIRPPEHRIHFSARHVNLHGICYDHCRDQPTFAELWPTLSEYIAGRTFVAHGAAAAEVNILRGLFETYQLSPPVFNFACSLAIARSVWQTLEGHGLAKMAMPGPSLSGRWILGLGGRLGC